jgi:glycerol uptake facilitator-like aquaporin
MLHEQFHHIVIFVVGNITGAAAALWLYKKIATRIAAAEAKARAVVADIRK